MFARSDNSRRRLAALVLLVSAFAALSLARGLEDEHVDYDTSESGSITTTSTTTSETEDETKSESDSAEIEIEPEPTDHERDIGALLAAYQELNLAHSQAEPNDNNNNNNNDLGGGDNETDSGAGSRGALFDPVVRAVARFHRQGLRKFPRSPFFDCPRKPRYNLNGRRARMLYYNPSKGRSVRMQEFNGGWAEGDLETFLRHGFDLQRPTLTIMGGWMQHPGSEWIPEFKGRVEEMRPNINLLIYDWSDYGIDLYETSVSFVPHMGSVLAKFFELLIDKHNYTTDHIQLVSFSLSTHVTGVAGRQLRAKYGKPIPLIHALDPTGVCFHDTNADVEFARDHGLRPTDAKLVLARHYNMEQLGAGRFIGGLDIVVNNGKRQPRMRPNRHPLHNVLAGLGIFLNSHMRTVDHETTKFNAKADCHEVAYECESHESFLRGECAHCRAQNQSCFHIHTLGNIVAGQRPQEMNFAPGTEMYLVTGESQFCERLFQAVVKLADSAPSETVSAFKASRFRVRVAGLLVDPSNHVTSKGRNIFTQLVRPGKLPDPFPDEVSVGEEVRPLLKEVKYLAITYMSHMSPHVRKKHSIKYCPSTGSQGGLKKCR